MSPIEAVAASTLLPKGRIHTYRLKQRRHDLQETEG